MTKSKDKNFFVERAPVVMPLTGDSGKHGSLVQTVQWINK